MSTKSKKTEHPKEEPKAAVPEVVKTNLPSTQLVDMSEDEGSGNENVTAANMAIPIISILQANSPQCKRSDPKYIPGAVEGMFYNNVSEKIEGDEDGITVVSCFFEKVYLEWKPNRGGFAGAHPENTPLRSQVKMVKNAEGKEIPTLPNGNNLVETDQNYVLVLKRDGSFSPAVIAMASSGLRASRLWNTLANEAQVTLPDGRKIRAPRFAIKYQLTTRGKQKDTYSWATWVIAPAGQLEVSDPATARAEDIAIYNAAKMLKKAVEGGAIRVKQEQHDDAGAPAGVKDDDIPLDF